MRIEDRLGLAQLAYRRAVADIRADSTRTAWRRLVRAARNLRDARGDVHKQTAERAGGRTPPGSPAAGPALGPGAKVIRLGPPARPSLRDRWPELAAQCERARELAQLSRALVEQSRRLRHDLADFLRRHAPASLGEASPPREGEREPAGGEPRALDRPTGRS